MKVKSTVKAGGAPTYNHGVKVKTAVKAGLPPAGLNHALKVKS